MSHAQVFRAIEALRWAPVTQKDIAIVAEMEPRAVGFLIRELRDDFGFIEAAGYGKSTGGCKPVLWRWKP